LVLVLFASLQDLAWCIYKGSDVSSPGKYPWMASVQDPSGKHICGAVITGKKWLVSSRVCLDDFPYRNSGLTVVVGAHDVVTQTQGSPKRYEVDMNIPQEHCIMDNDYGCDLSVIVLKENIKMGPSVSAIALPDAKEKFHKATECVILGWGQTGDKTSAAESANILQEQKVGVMTENMCNKKVPGKESWEILCAKSYGGSRPGDFGGPLACKQNGSWRLAGVSSFIIGEGGKTTNRAPSVFTDVSKERRWIDGMMWDGK